MPWGSWGAADSGIGPEGTGGEEMARHSNHLALGVLEDVYRAWSFLQRILDSIHPVCQRLLCQQPELMCV